MENVELNSIQQLIIKSMWEIKTPEYIANMLDVPPNVVTRAIAIMNKVHKVKLYQRPTFERKLKKADVELLKEKPVVPIPDVSKKISVRIDAKTVVFVNQGADIEAIKARYSRASVWG